MPTTSSFTASTTVVLGDTCGYVFQLEQIQLNAQLMVINPHPVPVKLQLWACKQAFTGGKLDGHKIGETAANSYQQDTQIIETVNASWPAGTESYVMVLALADEQGVLSYINFSQTQIFLLPHLVAVSYEQTASDIVVNIGQIYNPRPVDNLSGTLCLELWAVNPLDDSAGEVLNVQILGVLAGQASWTDYQLSAALPNDVTHFSLRLKEWTAHGYVIRDYVDFAIPVAAQLEVQEVQEVQEVAKTESALPSLNSATVVKLATIKGVSRTIAQLIVKNKPYTDWQQVLQVRGVGVKLLEKLQAEFAI